MEKKTIRLIVCRIFLVILTFTSIEVKSQEDISLKDIFLVLHYLDKTHFVPIKIGDNVSDSLIKRKFEICQPPSIEVYNVKVDSVSLNSEDSFNIDSEISDFKYIYESIETPSIIIIPINDSIKFGMLNSVLTQNKHHGFIYFNNNSDEVILIVNCESFSDRIIEDNKTFFITCFINKEIVGYFTYYFGDINYGYGKYCAFENGESVLKYITTEEDLNRISINEATSLSDLINGFILINQKLPKNNGCACLTYYCDMKSKLFDIIKKWP